MKRGIVFLVCAIVVALPAGAQQMVDESRPVAADAIVTFESISGSVMVSGWDRNEVHVTGTLGRGIERLDVTGGGSRLDIRVVYPHDCEHCGGADLEIRLPAGSRPEIETVSANIEMGSLRGDVRAASVSGDVTIATTGSVRAKSVSGEVSIRGAGDRLQATSVSGDVEAVMGAIADGELETVSGDIRVEADIAPRGRLEAHSVSGSVELLLPAGVGASFEAESFSGSIRNDLGPEARRKSEHGPGRELSFQSGDGSARVYVKSFSGEVRLLKK